MTNTASKCESMLSAQTRIVESTIFLVKGWEAAERCLLISVKINWEKLISRRRYTLPRISYLKSSHSLLS